MALLHHSLSLDRIHLNSIFFHDHRGRLDLLNKRNRRRILKAVKRESEYEVDPDKAREALRKLDEQLLSLSQKKVDTPKIRATDLNLTSNQLPEETNAIDGPDTVAEIDLMLETLQAGPVQLLLD